MQPGVEPLDGRAGMQHRLVEPLGLLLALAQVALDLGPHRTRDVDEEADLLDLCLHRHGRLARRLTTTPTHDAGGRRCGCSLRPACWRRCGCRIRYGYAPLHLVALDEVHHAGNLVRRQATQQRQADIAVSLRLREAEADHEHLLVVAHLAVIGVPRGHPDVEARVLRQDFLVQGIECGQVAVRRRQQCVEQF